MMSLRCLGVSLGTVLLLSAVAILFMLDAPVERPVDLSGTYDAGTLTPLERPAGFGDQLEIDPSSRVASRLLAYTTTEAIESLEAVSHDLGKTHAMINGRLRSSIITHPENGRLPPLTADARIRLERKIEAARLADSGGSAWWLNTHTGPYDGPEDRPLQERCLLDGVGSAGPPALPAKYNNIKRIVQTKDAVILVNEMIHDARVIRLGGVHPPMNIRRWLGDSIGWWEGSTLVVETTNFRRQPGLFMATENLKVIERFRRSDEGSLLYSFVVEDETVWEESWSGEYLWRSTDQKMYEYACHEGNYSLAGILRGARAAEAEARSVGEASDPSAASEGMRPPGTERNSTD